MSLNHIEQAISLVFPYCISLLFLDVLSIKMRQPNRVRIWMRINDMHSVLNLSSFSLLKSKVIHAMFCYDLHSFPLLHAFLQCLFHTERWQCPFFFLSFAVYVAVFLFFFFTGCREFVFAFYIFTNYVCCTERLAEGKTQKSTKLRIQQLEFWTFLDLAHSNYLRYVLTPTYLFFHSVSLSRG